MLSAGFTTANSISLSWTSAGSEGVIYDLIWQRDTSIGCLDEDDDGSTTITDGSTTYDIMRLEEDSSYIIIVTASNSNSVSKVSNTVTAMTQEAGKVYIF